MECPNISIDSLFSLEVLPLILLELLVGVRCHSFPLSNCAMLLTEAISAKMVPTHPPVPLLLNNSQVVPMQREKFLEHSDCFSNVEFRVAIITEFRASSFN
jgi:hypothetical protein